jgi:hypothetical protein
VKAAPALIGQALLRSKDVSATVIGIEPDAERASPASSAT